MDETKYPFRHTEYPARDAVFNWIVRRHVKVGKKPWQRSDDWVWGGFIYHIWSWIPLLLFLYFVYFAVSFTYTHYGQVRAMTILAIFVLVRLNSLIRQVTLTNRLLKKAFDIK